MLVLCWSSIVDSGQTLKQWMVIAERVEWKNGQSGGQAISALEQYWPGVGSMMGVCQRCWFIIAPTSACHVVRDAGFLYLADRGKDRAVRGFPLTQGDRCVGRPSQPENTSCGGGARCVLCCVLLCLVISCCVMLCYVVLCCVLLCCVVLCCVVFCCVPFCSVLFCSVLFCSVLFCSVLFCSDLIWSDLIWSDLIWSVLSCYFVFCIVSCSVPYRSNLRGNIEFNILWRRLNFNVTETETKLAFKCFFLIWKIEIMICGIHYFVRN